MSGNSFNDFAVLKALKRELERADAATSGAESADDRTQEEGIYRRKFLDDEYNSQNEAYCCRNCAVHCILFEL